MLNQLNKNFHLMSLHKLVILWFRHHASVDQIHVPYKKTIIRVTYLLHVARAIALGSKTCSHLIASSNHDLNNIPDCPNSSGLQTSSLYLRQLRKRHFKKLEIDRLETQRCQ
ncbi:hypothetical protein KSF78_0000432 [Schistosoma japonicum]|nr:hypothetical protein KSF78_0000432 [Schistosoma japonicum]